MRGGSYGLLVPGHGGGGMVGGGGQLGLAGGWLLRASRVIPVVLFFLVIASLCAHYYLSKVRLVHTHTHTHTQKKKKKKRRRKECNKVWICIVYCRSEMYYCI